MKGSFETHIDQKMMKTVLQYGLLYIGSIAILAAHLKCLCDWVTGGHKRLRQVQPLIGKLLQGSIHISKQMPEPRGVLQCVQLTLLLQASVHPASLYTQMLRIFSWHMIQPQTHIFMVAVPHHEGMRFLIC